MNNKNKNKNKDNKNNSILNKNINSNIDHCVTPCYPKNTIFYSPFNYLPIINEKSTCITLNNNLSKNCDIKDNIDNYNVLSNVSFYIKNSNTFLSLFYNINNADELPVFMNDTIDNLPIYTQKRLLQYIFENYKNDINFPINLFVTKIINVFHKIYNVELDIHKITKKINNLIINNNNDIFIYLTNKYIN